MQTFRFICELHAHRHVRGYISRTRPMRGGITTNMVDARRHQTTVLSYRPVTNF
jgi:hypothetical protein